MNKRRDYLLEKYFNIDQINKIAYLNLHYDKASDILNLTSSKDNYLINDDVINSINNLIKMIPSKFKVEINLTIDDYMDYEKEDILKSFNDSIEMNYYQREQLAKYRNLKVGFLVAIGVLLLSAMVYFKSNYIDSNELSTNIISEVIDITAWVFIWEAVTVAFLTKLDLPFDSRLLLIRVKTLNLIESDKVSTSLDLIKESSKWDYTSRIKKLVNTLYLFTGVVFFALGALGIIKFIDNSYRNSLLDVPVLFTTQVCVSICEMFAGIGISLVYLGARNKTFEKFITVFNILILVQIVISIINQFAIKHDENAQFREFSSMLAQGHAFYLFTVILYIVSRALERILERREIIIEEKEKQINEKLNLMFNEDTQEEIYISKKNELRSRKEDKIKKIKEKRIHGEINNVRT